MADFIPGPDEQFDKFVDLYKGKIDPDVAIYGMTAADKAELDAAVTQWKTDYQAQVDYLAGGETITLAKNSSRAALEKIIRSQNKRIQAKPGVTDAQRADAGLPVHDVTITRAAVPTTKPVVRIDSSKHLRHELSWADETTPGSRAKPAGVKHALIFLKIGDAPASLADCTYVASDSATPYTYEFAAADAGKIAHWILAWENTHNERGPQSDTTSATIPS